jgi:hypothetical protein
MAENLPEGRIDPRSVFHERELCVDIGNYGLRIAGFHGMDVFARTINYQSRAGKYKPFHLIEMIRFAGSSLPDGQDLE